MRDGAAPLPRVLAGAERFPHHFVAALASVLHDGADLVRRAGARRVGGADQGATVHSVVSGDGQDAVFG